MPRSMEGAMTGAGIDLGAAVGNYGAGEFHRGIAASDSDEDIGRRHAGVIALRGGGAATREEKGGEGRENQEAGGQKR
jgi:hypothetical protein